jgi:hypothetical protein
MTPLISSCALLALVIAELPSVWADGCTVRPPNGEMRAVYSIVSGWPASDLQLLVDEYTYQHTWRRHSEAVQGGLRYGDVVFGETLNPGLVFDGHRVEQWKLAYAQRQRKHYVDRLASQLADYSIDRDLVQTVITTCLRPSLWSALSAVDECRFTFVAGLRAPQPGHQVFPVKFRVIGGRCDAWPDQPIGAEGHMVRCLRSGNGNVAITLDATRAGSAVQVLPPLKARTLPQEPVMEQRMSEPIVEVLTVYRTRDYRLIGLGQGCPSCRLFAADIHPSQNNAVIVDVSVVASAEAGHWLRCPADYRCGTPEFSPPDKPNVSGCSGLNTCRVWRLSSDDAAGQDTIQVTSVAPESVCRNCAEGMDYAAAHKRWEEEIRARARRECNVFPDPPAQFLARGSRTR